MDEMAVVINICSFSSSSGSKTANIPIYVDQAEPVLLLITVQTLVLATRKTGKAGPNGHDMVVPDFIVKRTWLCDGCRHGEAGGWNV